MPPPLSIGLCATCTFCRTVEGARSTFYMCGRSVDDPRFPRYPPLPVARCLGYQQERRGPAEQGESDKL